MDPDRFPPGHGAHAVDAGFGALPFLGLMMLLLVVATAVVLYLHRQGKINLPQLGRPRSPEDQAKAILAERFARGDISTEDFMERSSILNWTPGSDTVPARPRGRRR